MNGQLWKESLNSDHFNQYKKHEQSPLILTHWTQAMTTKYDDGNPGHGLGQEQHCDGVNVIPMLPLDNCISNGNTYKTSDKNMHRRTSTQKDHIYYHNNEWMTSMDNTIARSTSTQKNHIQSQKWMTT